MVHLEGTNDEVAPQGNVHPRLGHVDVGRRLMAVDVRPDAEQSFDGLDQGRRGVHVPGALSMNIRCEK